MTIYDQLNTKTLGNVAANDIQSLQDRVHIQEVNKEELETYNLINKATFRDGLPIPNSGLIKTVSQNVDGNELVLVFRPALGEVYQLTGASTALLAGTRIELFLSDGTSDVEIGAETAAATQFDPFGSAPVFIDNNVYLNTFLVGGTGIMSVGVSMIRIR